MKNFLSNISIQVNPHSYLKDPESSPLGKRIIAGSIDLIEEIGFENFTFQKLAKTIKSTEASVYRYFESKHKLLRYLTIWYWGWLEYHFIFKTANIDSPEEKLKRAILLLTKPLDEDSSFSHINEIKLQNIIISESSKVFLTKEVDQENKAGVYAGYKKLVGRVSDIILEINPQYKYPHMLVSTIIEGAHNQHFFADHLPGLTNKFKGKDTITEFYKEMVFRTIQE
ncbi:MAG: TetR/AcrR family transcriptional regulator [Salegentibacter sp.]|uniref:Transcriptional regulator, TetR family n=1 Tax=Salegentibacter flavus TaxID=287099 RepID=A0A1I5B4X7_9FLAO|nr:MULTISPECIES: TetR/AcrR family transcriptional regulator [Salegentibacter]MDR9458008.1 TetR/AcrR family transcriptional regulator [Salegentibacter sp.]SFN69743.1 transcriptional regulator, TetR family [Salegentibacter flavus]